MGARSSAPTRRSRNSIPQPGHRIAAKALGFIWPDLKITGKAYRVPVRTGSIVELNVVPEREVSTKELRDLFRAAAATTRDEASA